MQILVLGLAVFPLTYLRIISILTPLSCLSFRTYCRDRPAYRRISLPLPLDLCYMLYTFNTYHDFQTSLKLVYLSNIEF
ncbi:hypothetical protein F4818DRAFT_270027 [Hypoxylon cercidicola]|nr:hypothetical protein F4818DRAFT_270027 [Hypoxylon cercidicola]